jgi:nucleotide-binding universal stress UspA family protein
MAADTIHQCPLCELRFTYRTELDDHRRADHAPAVRDDVPAPVAAGIVVPVDPFRPSTMAVSVAAVLARQAGLGVDIVTAPPYWLPQADVTTRVSQARAAGVPWAGGEVLRTTGDPAAAIVDHVRRHRAAMVCMAPRGRAQFGEMVLGSVSAGVVRSSPVPVLLVGPRVEHFGPRVERIVACLDGSETAERVLPVARDLAAQLSAELMLVRVVCGGEADDRPAPAAGVEVVHDDSPAGALAHYGGDRGDTVLAMATRDRGAFRRLVLGSVSRTVVHQAACPVLVVPVRA